MEILQFTGQFVVTIVINLITFLLFKNMYGTKYEKKSFYFLSYFFIVCLMIFVNKIGNPYLNAAYLYFSINLICLTLFESNFKKVWLHNLLIWFIYVFCDTSTVLIWSAINGKTLEGILSDEQLMIGSNIMNIIFMCAAYRIYLTFNQKLRFNSIQIKIAVFMITLTFFETWVVISYASQISDRRGGLQIMIILIGFLLVDLFLAYILNHVAMAYKYENELNLIKQLQKMQLESYKETERKYRESRAIIHDIKKHLDVIDELRANDKEKADEYRKHIDIQMEKIFCGYHCSNRIMGIILSQKMSKAKSEGIKVAVSVDEINIDFIDDLDITAIFANLWDNAIEACAKVENNKYIKFSLSRYNGFLLIDLENSFDGIYKKSGNKFLSTKKQHNGVGISSIATSVSKYDGFFSASESGNVFKSEITIPIPIKR